MVVYSVNERFEQDLLSDQGFICSHISTYLTTRAANEVSGQALEAYLVGSRLTTYESLGQDRPRHLVSDTTNALDQLHQSELIFSQKCLQSVLSAYEIERPIVGLPSIILLNEIINLPIEPSLKGNVFTTFDYEHDLDLVIEIPSYITDSPSAFCADTKDVDVSRPISDTQDICLYVPYQAYLTAQTNTQFCIDNPEQDWVYRLIHHYTQGQYDLALACKYAKRSPFAFALIIAPMLGVVPAKLKAYKDDDSYKNMSDIDKYTFVTTIKPLVEQIALDFMSDKLRFL